jgi:hypothetical protein
MLTLIKRAYIFALISCLGTPAQADFLETFTGNPATPQSFGTTSQSVNWDVAVHSRAFDTFLQLEPMEHQHGPDCGPPIDAAGQLVTHHSNGDYAEAVFQCRDHVMTSLNAGDYGVIYLAPNQLLDFSNGTATLKFDVSTLITSRRDWIDVWLTPFAENMALPLTGLPDLQGHPKESVHIYMDFNPVFKVDVIRNYDATTITDALPSYTSILTPSPRDRVTFQLEISRTHVRFGIPPQAFTTNQSMYWVDREIPALSWDKAVVQLGHHSYNPYKACDYDGTCQPNTWHWDNVSLSPSVPFTMIKGDRRYVYDNEAPDTINFARPAPANSFLRFSAIGTPQISLNGGSQWTNAVRQQGNSELEGFHHPEHFSSYWTPIPAGTQSIRVRLTPDDWYAGNWPYMAQDFAIWSLTTAAPPVGSACDVNGDGFTNVSDVQLCANQAIGTAACSTGDINQDSFCTVVDVQRVVNAALGGQCVTQ